MAKRLGFSIVCVLTTTPFEVLEKVIPLAEEYRVKMGLEIHAPMSMKFEWADKWYEIINRTGTKYAGFIPDFGIFSKRPFTVLTDNLVHQGANPEIVDYIVRRYTEIMDARISAINVKKLGMELLQASAKSMRWRMKCAKWEPPRRKSRLFTEGILTIIPNGWLTFCL